MRQILCASFVFGLVGCASTTTVYQPAASTESVGYRETRIEDNRFRVSFNAGSDLDAAQVEALALRRAAELTLQYGMDWFEVVNRETDRSGGEGRNGTSLGIGGSTGSYGSSVGVGIGLDLGSSAKSYRSILEVLLGSGDVPDRPKVYHARRVLENLESDFERQQ